VQVGKIRIYLAGPLFSLAERNFNRTLASFLEAQFPNCAISFPQEYANTIAEKESFGDLMFDYCLKEIDRSNMVIAVLDGPDVDSGTCIEIGYAYAKKKPVIGVRTDFRASEDRGVNLMVS
jgi:nucleoside 2-deoxyribosyltransferase